MAMGVAGFPAATYVITREAGSATRLNDLPTSAPSMVSTL